MRGANAPALAVAEAFRDSVGFEEGGSAEQGERVRPVVYSTSDGETIEVALGTRAFRRAVTFTSDVAQTLTGAVPTVLDWRLWHARFHLVRAERVEGSVIRDATGLLGDDATSIAEPTDLLARWAKLREIWDWCAARGLRPATSAGAIGIELLSGRFKPNFPPLFSRLNDEERLRVGLLGGRCERFLGKLDKGGAYRSPCIYYDANGAYLDVIRTVALPYPYRPLDGVQLRAEGITRATITETCKYPVLANQAGAYTADTKTGWWSNAEIRRAVDFGAKIEKTYEGMHFSCTTRALHRLGDYLAECRESAKTPVERTLAKRIPNALIGRFASVPSYCVTKAKSEADDWRERPSFIGAVHIADGVSVAYRMPRRTPWYACGWSIAILAAQRLRLHERLTSFDAAGYDVLYCDTDGIMLGLNGQPEPPTGHEVGQYKVEWRAAGAVIRGTKAYVAKLKDGGAIVKKAGLHGVEARKRYAQATLFQSGEVKQD